MKSDRLVLLPLFALLATLGHVRAQSDFKARFCCQEGEILTVRNLGRDRRVAECVSGEETPRGLEGMEVWAGGEQGGSKVLRKLEVKQPTCTRGLVVVGVRINATDSQENGTIPLFGSNVISLKGGDEPGQGNLFVNGEPVCDDSWEEQDARVACRMLGYSGGRATHNSRFGNIPGGVYGMDNVECEGYEDDITDCRFSSDDDCSEDEAAGVICGEGDIADTASLADLTLDGGLKIVTLTPRGYGRNHNSTVLKPQGEFCLTQDTSLISTHRQEEDQEGVQAVYCDQCTSQVLCHYSKLLFNSITGYRGVMTGDREDIMEQGFVAVADSNDDSEVDFEEFLENLKEYIRTAFGVMDKNDDNSISEEVKAGEILTRYSLEFFETALVHLMDFFDTNKNNALEQEDALFGISRRYIDRNEDGVVTLSELLGTSLISLPAPLYNLYTKLDRNKDERLSQEEAIDFIKRTFALIDSNSDCFVDEAEIVALFKNLDIPGDMQLAIKLILKKYLTLASFLMEQFAEKADKDKDGKVTVEEVIGFEDFDFIDDSIPIVTRLGYPSGALPYLVSAGHGPGRREREQETVAMWLTALQELMEKPEYNGPEPNSACFA